MKPQGQTPVKFPSKTDCHPRDGSINWWEDISIPNKKSDRQKVKKEIKNEIINLSKL